MAITQTFATTTISGLNVNNPTSLQIGPDGRLYVSQVNGIIKIYDLQRDADGNWTASNEETINSINQIPNHDDDGSLNLGQNDRQVTGIAVEGTAENPVIYVSSSDPRIGGAAGSGDDTNLDTNSGIISRLTWNGATWDKVDLVIGLPRSEENHSTNGMDIRTEDVNGELHQIMYIASGGHTNKGAPSNNFAWTPEYYYSAAVLRVDLTQLQQMEAELLAGSGLNGGTAYVDEYVYALPTLDDPTRANTNGINTVLYRVNAGGPQITAIDGLLDWAADTSGAPNGNLADPGSNNTATFPAVEPGATVPQTTPGEVFDTERWDFSDGSEMAWAFPTPVPGDYEIRLYVGNGYTGTAGIGERVYDVSIEGQVPANLDDIDLSADFGNEIGAMISNVVTVTDGTLNIEFLHGIENPLINAIEIIQLGAAPVEGEGAQDSAAGSTGPADAEAADTFGGNDGLNQAKFDPGGPVQVYSTGYRNAYDVTITEAGNIYTFDNGPNNGWGDIPQGEDGSFPASTTDPAGFATNAPHTVDTGNDGDPDGLHLVTDGFYAGHPNPTRASGAAAGLYEDSANGSELAGGDLPADWDTITGGNTNPEEGVYAGGAADGSLLTIGSSSNGLTEYTASGISDNPFAEVLAVASFNGDITFIEITSDGTQGGTSTTDTQTVNVGQTPLDVWAVGDGGIDGFGTGAGAVFVATFGGDGVVVLEPGTPTEPTDDFDNDLILDKDDPLQYDPNNGTTLELNDGERILFTLNPADPDTPGPDGPWNIGFNGWMVDGVTELNPDLPGVTDVLADLDNTIRGGAPGTFQVKAVGDGDLTGATNTLRDAMQGGFQVGASVDLFNVRVPILNPFTSDSAGNLENGAYMGFALGDGTQDEYLGVFVEATGTQQGGFKVVYETGGVVQESFSVTVPEIADGADEDQIELFLRVDMNDRNAIEVQAFYRLQIDGAYTSMSPVAIVGGANDGVITLAQDSKLAQVLRGEHTILDTDTNPQPSSTIVTLLASSTGPTPAFTADFLDVDIVAADLPAAVVVANQADLDAATPTPGIDTVDFIGPGALNVPAGWENLLLDNNSNDGASVTLNVGNNVVTSGTGAHTVNLGGGDDTVFGDQTTLDGDTFGDFDPGDRIVIIGAAGASFTAAETSSVDVAVDVDGGGADFIFTLSDDINSANVLGQDDGNDFVISVAPGETVLYRVNAGGPQITAIDGLLDWSADTSGTPNGNLADPGSNNTATFPAVEPGTAVPQTTPGQVFDTERWDNSGGSEMAWAFPTPVPGDYEIRLYVGNGYTGTAGIGERVYDVSIEGQVPANLDDIDLSADFGNEIGAMISNVVTVTDGTLNIEFLHGIENPLINAIEIIQLGAGSSDPLVSIVGGDQVVAEGGGQVQISLASSQTVPVGETVTVDFEIIPGSATPQLDYEYTSPTFSFNAITGIYTDSIDIAGGSSDATFLIDIIQDTIDEADEAFIINLTGVSPNAQIGAATTTVTIQDDDLSQGTIVAAINAGGSALTQDGIDFSADQFFLNGTTFNGSEPAFDGTVYDTERYGGQDSGTMSYEIPVGAGDYTVELYFAEIFQSNPGERIFDVLVEGQTVLDDFDILAENGGDVTQPIIFQIPDTVSADTFGNPNAIDIDFSASVDNGKVSAIVVREAAPPTGGEAEFSVTPNANDIQVSTYGENSFQIINTGTKNITQVDIDVTNALFRDSVFDPFGVAGDTIAKELEINTPGGTGVVAPSNASYLGAGGTAGFEGLRLVFDVNTDNGFEPGETIGFSVDMDPNSIAGTVKSTLESGADPSPWDIGGISGAELIGSTYTVTFEDGTTATGQLQGNDNQGGAQGQASQDSPSLAVNLTVNGLGEGGVGTYNGAPTVIINGPAGETARVVLAKGFIQPGENNFGEPFASQLEAQLDALAAADFPANNAVEFQTVDVALDGFDQDISNLFDVSQFLNGQSIGGGGWTDLAGDQVPLGFVASVIDPADNNLPIGDVTAPIYLQFTDLLPADLELSKSVDNATPFVGDHITFTLTVDNFGTGDATGVQVEDVLSAGYTFVSANGDGTYDEATGLWNIGLVANGTSTSIDITVAVDDVPAGPVLTPLFRINAGGPEVAATDGGPTWSQDQSAVNANGSATIGTPSIYLIDRGIAGDDITYGDNTPPGPGENTTTAPDALFVTERFGTLANPDNIGYAFDVANGDYQVDLFFDEVYFTSAGSRVFDVEIEGNLELDDFDTFAAFGSDSGVQSIQTTVTDGQLNIEFLKTATNNPHVAAIQVSSITNVLDNSAYENYAQILSSNEVDPDSTPGDNSVGDDDDATVVVDATQNGQNELSIAATADGIFGNNDANTLRADPAGSTMSGGGGNDTLISNIGPDFMTGGSGDDLFVLGGADGADTISDFTAGAGTDDVIDISIAAYSFSAFDDGTINDVESFTFDAGSDTVIDLGMDGVGVGDDLTLLGVNKAALHEDDFKFT